MQFHDGVDFRTKSGPGARLGWDGGEGCRSLYLVLDDVNRKRRVGTWNSAGNPKFARKAVRRSTLKVRHGAILK